ncbi:MAG TPA: sulfatase [Thermoanaerobaculia bacterium]|nr:sulfatase [Thermoanaerobaculia bacterium]
MIRKLLLILLVALPASARVTVPEGALKGWNVVLITLDATNPKRIATYGGNPAVMPYLDSLAKQSLVMEHAYCTTGSTAPSHATMMTGVLPHRHRVFYNGLPLAPKVWWLPEELQKRGYVTAASTIAFFMGKAYDFDRGWNTFVAATTEQTPIGSNAGARKLFSEPLASLANRKGPFFAWVHLKGGHAPLVPIDKKHLSLFAPNASGDKLPAKYDEELANATERRDVEQKWLKYYDANLHEADVQLKALLDSFRAAGLTKNTLFVILADHGESFDHGILDEHWPSPWESTLRIPMLFYAETPGMPKGRINDRLVMTTDLTPTLLYLLGIKDGPQESDGQNIFGANARQTFNAASASSIAYEDFEVQALKLSSDTSDSAKSTMNKLRFDAGELERTGIFYWAYVKRMPDGHIYKLVHFGSSKKRALAGGPGAVQLYDIGADPAEVRDLVSEQRTIASSLLREARTNLPLFGRLGAVEGMTTANPAAMTQGLDKEAIEKLKALGYLH